MIPGRHVVVVANAATPAERLALRNELSAIRIKGGWANPARDATGTMFAWGFFITTEEEDTTFDLEDGTAAALRALKRKYPAKISIYVDRLDDWRTLVGWTNAPGPA